MEIKLFQASENPAQLISAKLASIHLKLNQQLEVKIIQANKQTNRLSLQLTQSAKSIEVQSTLPLQIKQGQTLKLLVSQLLPSPEFKILNADSDILLNPTEHSLKNIVLKQITPLRTNTIIKDTIQISTAPQQQEKIVSTLKQVLPKQQQFEVLFNQMIISLDKINKNESVSISLKRLAKQLLASIPHDNSSINASQLKTLIANSGLFMEAKLAQAISQNYLGTEQDVKVQLLKFQQALKQELDTKQQSKLTTDDVKLLKEILQKTENSLSRIILNQLASLPKDDGVKQAWIIDLPFLDKEFAQSIKIEINQEQQPSSDEHKENWSVIITVTPPELATIHCRINCIDDSISTLFWSETSDVVEKINQNLDFLKSQLKKVGINPGHMSAHTGHAIKESQTYPAIQNLLDQQV